MLPRILFAMGSDELTGGQAMLAPSILLVVQAEKVIDMTVRSSSIFYNNK